MADSLHVRFSQSSGLKEGPPTVVRVITSSYIMDINDDMIINTGPGTVIVDLPFATADVRNRYVIKNEHATALLIILRKSPDTIDGNIAYSLGFHEAYTVVSDGTNWFITSFYDGSGFFL
jgi:hypothetical protein